MCGGSEKDIYDPNRFGALAVLSVTSGVEQDLSGQLLFFNESHHESSVATHVRYIPTGYHPLNEDLILTIFCTGDLTIPPAQCKQLESFTLSETESRLGQQLLLHVGGSGIIGRRIAISSSGFPQSSVAEGIVGFNHGLIA
ncbi:hypothetical protein VP1G_11420 [Cytospora mali]|uniref:Uncharacterized protein n=1 Tax=Cytospora mali TaxID=578113 RepID=A0A194VG02_CYTMA|nr:hypothetical protein VP1G_11420 [Valsa mali var. pyri (nom. inval.)]